MNENMDPSVLLELEKRINDLREVVEPNSIEQGMTGSRICFNMYLKTLELISYEEYTTGVYDEWLDKKQNELIEYSKTLE